uniref:ER membrane protein complex subunit 10 n=1 Tax=Daphnia sinensis TaxID=1820382 RepID=A0A4Y7N8P7_9CRUS|nr:EOG090X0JXR [Daphnia sinensis]
MALQSVLQCFIAVCLLSTPSKGELESDASSVVQLSHSLGSRPFEPRGQINVRSLKSGSVNIQQDSSYDWKDYKEAAEANEFYHLEAFVKYNGIERTFLTSTKACLLYESQLADIITIHVDLLGNIYGVSVATPHSQQCTGTVLEFEPNFNTTVLISYMEHGPVPDVAMYVQKVEQEKVAKERGETKDNRSFIAKYWMYIVPLVLVFMMSGASNPEQPAR